MLGAASREKMEQSDINELINMLNDSRELREEPDENIAKPPTQSEKDLVKIIFPAGNQYDEFGNIHAWVIEDGKIHDPTPLREHMTVTAYLMGLDIERPYYKAFCPEKCRLLHRLTVMKWMRHTQTHRDRCFTNPKIGYCYYNALAYCLKNKNATIQFGQMGYYYKGRDDVYLEWGDTDAKSYEGATNVMANKFNYLSRTQNRRFKKLLMESPRDDEEITMMRRAFNNKSELKRIR